MRRFILWIAAILITFAIGVGADRLWWHFFTASPAPARVEPAAAVAVPEREIVYVPAPAPPPPSPPKPHLILDYDSEKLWVWGMFYIMGPQSKEFADIDYIEAELSPNPQDYPGSIGIYTHRGDEYDGAQAIFVLVTEQRLFFATEKLGKGDSTYRFDGSLCERISMPSQEKTRPCFVAR